MLKFSVNDLKNVAKLCDISNTDYSSETLEILTKLLNWPKSSTYNLFLFYHHLSDLLTDFL